ncbi:RNA polymerase sigma factor [Gluconobacter potus]|uniref:RNA polymerase sigma factor n=1 Tax=Gluconobacter potus TaxID=2724927 RepID=UPI0039ECCABB
MSITAESLGVEPPEGKDLIDVILEQKAVLKSVVRRVLGSDDRADDVLQDVQVQLLLRQRRGDSVPERPFQFVWSAVYNRALDLRRSAKREMRRMEGIVERDEIPCGSLGAISVSPERHAIGRQEMTRLSTQLAALPPRMRQAFILVEIDGMKLREAGEVMGISPHGVWRAAREAMERLSGTVEP